MRLFELAYMCRLYSALTNSDRSYKSFIDNTEPSFDILDCRHRKALLEWLNSWGCRQFARSFHYQASENLRIWGEENLNRIPPAEASLLTFTDFDFINAGNLYMGLRDLQASVRKSKGKSRPVTFGPTGAAKILFALRSQVFPPWDDPIRIKRGYNKSKESYIKYLQRVRKELQEVVDDAKANGLAVEDIPTILGRPLSSLPKLVDEYNWVTITKNCNTLSLEDINNWWCWARIVDHASDNTAYKPTGLIP